MKGSGRPSGTTTFTDTARLSRNTSKGTLAPVSFSRSARMDAGAWVIVTAVDSMVLIVEADRA